MESRPQDGMWGAMGKPRSGRRWTVWVPVGAVRGAAGLDSWEGAVLGGRSRGQEALTISCILARKGGKGGT